MSLRQLPEARAFAPPPSYHLDAPADALARWSGPLAAAKSANVISIFDIIGTDPVTGDGATAASVAGALRAIGRQPVTVQVNSPGGSVFEGIAIYNLLRSHPAKVTVDVLGLAASAASVIAMAGDEIRMAPGTMMMVHRPWGLVIGNDEDFREAAETFKAIGDCMVDIYQARTGRSRAEIDAMMVGETFMSADEAVAERFADRVDKSKVSNANASVSAPTAARKQIDVALARAGVSRVERRRMLNDFEAGPPPVEVDECEFRCLIAAMTELT